MRARRQRVDEGLDVATVERAVAAMTWDDRKRLARRLVKYLSKSALTRGRLEERDRALLSMALKQSGDIQAVADGVHRAIFRYETSTWRFEGGRDTPSDPRHADEHRVLRLNRGRTPAAESLRKFFGECRSGPKES